MAVMGQGTFCPIPLQILTETVMGRDKEIRKAVLNSHTNGEFLILNLSILCDVIEKSAINNGNCVTNVNLQIPSGKKILISKFR